MKVPGPRNDAAAGATQRLERPGGLDGGDASEPGVSGDGSVFSSPAPTAMTPPFVVVVEDRATGLVAALQRTGFDVRVATSGLQAMALVGEHDPDAVVIGPGDAERRRIFVGAMRQRCPLVAVVLFVGDGDSIDASTSADVAAVLPWPLPPGDGARRALDVIFGASARRQQRLEATEALPPAPSSPLASELDAALNDDSAAATGPIRRAAATRSEGDPESRADEAPIVTATLVPQLASAEVELLASSDADPTRKLPARALARMTAVTSDHALSTVGAARVALPGSDDADGLTAPALPTPALLRAAADDAAPARTRAPANVSRALRECARQLEQCARALDDGARAGDSASAAKANVVREALRLVQSLEDGDSNERQGAPRGA